MSAKRSNSSGKTSSSSKKKTSTKKSSVSTKKKTIAKKSSASTKKKTTAKKSSASTKKKTIAKKSSVSTKKKTTPKKSNVSTKKKTTSKKTNAPTKKKKTAKKSNASTKKKTVSKKTNASTKKKTVSKKTNASTKKTTAVKKTNASTKKTTVVKKTNASTKKTTAVKKTNASTKKITVAKKTNASTKKVTVAKKTNTSTKKVTGSNISKKLTPISKKSYSNSSISFKYSPTSGRNVQTTQDKASKALIDLKKVTNILYGMSNKATNGIISTIERLQKNINRANSNLSASARKVSTAGSNAQSQIQNIARKSGSNTILKFGSNMGRSSEKKLLSSKIINTVTQQIEISIAQSFAIAKSEITNENWVGIKTKNGYYGFYVNEDGTIEKNKNINGVEFDKNGKAVDEIKYNMMLEAVNNEIPEVNKKLRQDAIILIDDDSYKIGILTRNNRGEWEFEEYEDCSNARNPEKRRRAGIYYTAGKWEGKEDKTSELPNFVIDVEGKSEFFAITRINNIETNNENNFIHTIAYDPSTANPQSKDAVISDGKLRTDVTNGCTRTTTEVAMKINEKYSDGVCVIVYDQKNFYDYSQEAQDEAIKSWSQEYKTAKENNDTEKIAKIKKDVYGYDPNIWKKIEKDEKIEKLT